MEAQTVAELFTANNPEDEIERKRFGEFYFLDIAATLELKREINWLFSCGGMSMGEWFRRTDQGNAWLELVMADNRALPGTWGEVPEFEPRFVATWAGESEADQDAA